MRLACSVLLLALSLAAQTETPSWAPKWKTNYAAPHQPLTRLKELLAKHKGEPNWREVIVNDELLKAEYISMAPGSKVAPRFHPDTREWWIVMDGKMRFDIEAQEPFVATKGSMVQVPMQTIYSMEAVGEVPGEAAGDGPALRLEVNIARAKTLFPQDVDPPKPPRGRLGSGAPEPQTGSLWLPEQAPHEFVRTGEVRSVATNALRA